MNNYFNGSGTIGFVCDNCGREMQGCTWVNGMKFCAKCYQETFGNTNPFEKEFKEKITALESKLAESEEELNNLEQQCLICNKDQENERLKQQLAEKDTEIEKVEKTYMKQKDYYVKEFNEVIYELKQQLAEKDKEIEELKRFDALNKTFFDLFRTAFKEPDKVDDLFNTLKTMQEKQDQDKISFAVEQLEKLKEEIEDGWKMVGYEGLCFNEVMGFIDNQIKQLKGEK